VTTTESNASLRRFGDCRLLAEPAGFVQLRQRAGDEPSSIIIGSARQHDWRFVPERQSRRFHPRDECRNL
jgi:hypothetical protein